MSVRRIRHDPICNLGCLGRGTGRLPSRREVLAMAELQRLRRVELAEARARDTSWAITNKHRQRIATESVDLIYLDPPFE